LAGDTAAPESSGVSSILNDRRREHRHHRHQRRPCRLHPCQRFQHHPYRRRPYREFRDCPVCREYRVNRECLEYRVSRDYRALSSCHHRESGAGAFAMVSEDWNCRAHWSRVRYFRERSTATKWW
jgi:hypothetical protein